MIKRSCLLGLAAALVVPFVADAAVRTVMMEQFTNVRCPPCASIAPTLDAFIHDHPDDLAVVYYHMYWPGYDPWWQDNQTDNGARRTYYQINGVPTCVMNGYKMGSISRAALDHWFNEAMAEPCYMDMSLSGHWNVGAGTGTVTVQYTAEQAQGYDDLELFVGLIENDLYWDGVSAYDWHHFVLRDILTSEHGDALDPYTSYPETRYATFDWVCNPDWLVAYEEENLLLYAFIQSNGTKDIVQSAMISVTDFSTVSVEGSTGAIVAPLLGQNHPNPFNPTTFIPITMDVAGDAVVTVYSPSGQLVRTLHTGALGAGTSEFQWDGRDFAGRELSSGVYYVRLETAKGSESLPITMLK